jgi:hypothetical protein
MVAYQRMILQELDSEKVVNRHFDDKEKNEFNYKLVQNALEQGLESEEKIQDEEETIHEEGKIEEDTLEPEYLDEEKKEWIEDEAPSIPVIDIEAIKHESYNEGYKKAKHELEQEIVRVKSEADFQKNISQEFSKLNFQYENYENQVCNASIKILHSMLERLVKKLPTDFEKIVTEQLTRLIKNNRVEAELIVKFNGKQQALMNEIYQKLALSEESKKYIKLEVDDNLTTEACQVYYREAALEYKEEQIVQEIDKILSDVHFGI